MRAIAAAALLCLFGPTTRAQEAVDTQALVAKATLAFELRADGTIAGPAIAHVRRETKDSQYVLFGESHHDRTSPRFALALYRALREWHGFDVAVVENDPLAMDAINAAPLRGDAKAIAGLAKRYPAHIGFASDQDLEWLAGASALGPVWGIEQAQGATRYLEELVALAPDDAVKARTQALADEARRKETREVQGAFIHDDETTLPRLEKLREDFAAQAGSRAAGLLEALVTTARIYSYNRRGMAGEYVGLYNNTEREALFKRTFVARYAAAAKPGDPLRAFFKMGDWHMYRGKSPGQAYTIGNFAHESAIWHGMDAYGICVMPIGGYGTWDDVEAWMKPLLPKTPPTAPILIDLRPLKPYARPLRELVAPADQWQLRDFLQGYDALVILPNSAKATWDLTGFPVP